MTERPILTEVKPQWVDHYGHMNLAYYLVVFDMACDVQWLDLGFGPDYRARGMGTFAAESWQAYIREVREGAPLACESVVLDFDDKRLLCRHLMYHAKEGWQVAENEVLYLSIDLTKRRMAPWPEDILARLAAHRSGETAKRLSLKPPTR
jgi:acyl-CoA thioester hydrolase